MTDRRLVPPGDDPLTKRLKLLARDSQNVAMNVLAIFTGTRKISQKRDKFSADLHKMLEQVTVMTQSWTELQELLYYLESKTGEIDERNLVKIVEGLADTAMLSASIKDIHRQAYIDCASRILSLDDNLFDVMVKEVQTHEGGDDKLSALFVAIEKLMKVDDNAIS